MSTIGYLILFFGGILFVGWLWYSAMDFVKDFIYRRKLKRLLGDKTLSEALDESPYMYGHFFGEDGYRIWRKDARKDEYVALGVSEKEAHLFIVTKKL